MPFVNGKIDALAGQPLVGDGDCVTLIKELAPGLKELTTASWREGELVVGSKGLVRGTAIATFVDGRYPNKKNGNHAAFFLAYGGKGIWVMDQWKNDKDHPTVAKRFIPPGRTKKDGTLINPSNSAQAFSVIELR